MPLFSVLPHRCAAAARYVAAGLLVAASLCAQVAQAANVGKQVEQIEATWGHEPEQVIARLAPLEPAARVAGGRDLLTFLAAWGYAHGALDKPTVADAAIAELGEIGQRDKDPMALAAAYALKGTMLQFAGQLQAAYGWIANAVPQARRTDNPSLQYWVYMSAGHLATLLGRVDEAIPFFDEAAGAARAERNDRRIAQARVAQAPLHFAQGRFDLALRDAETAYALAAKSEEHALMLSAKVYEALAAEQAGDAARQQRARNAAQGLTLVAERANERRAAGASAVEVNSQAGGPRVIATELGTRLELSTLNLSAHNYKTARAQAERAAELALAADDEAAAARAAFNRGMALLGLGQVRDGRRIADFGLETLQKLAPKDELLLDLHRYSALLDRRGESAAALSRTREALLIENELVRRDRLDTVLELQRKSSTAEHQRRLDALENQNRLQTVELGRHHSEQRLTLAIGGALGVGGLASLFLYMRVRKANRQLAVRHAELEYLSSHDRITGLRNRRELEARAARLAASQDGSFLGIGIAIKRFGVIVGSLGHETGDKLLVQIGQRLNAVVHAHGGTLYRLDGLSFGCIFPGAEMPGDPSALMSELGTAMEAPFAIEHQELLVTLAMGAAEYPRDGATPSQVARAIELATISARGRPGNSHVVYSEEMQALHRNRLQLEARLAQALELGEFQLHYQPQRALHGDRLCGFEALLRWTGRDGPVSPGLFIPLAEESGLIVPLGRWVLETACRQARAWADAGHGPVMVAINISPRQFQHPGFLQSVRDVLELTGVDPAQVELEITEGAVMQETETTIALLHALRGLGLALAIDDFGTGYASLAYLRRFPLNRLKIDQSFTRQLTARTEDMAIVKALIELSHSLGLEVVAEGVELADQEACLRRLQCDVIQGYWLARPAPAAAGTALLEAARATSVAQDLSA